MPPRLAREAVTAAALRGDTAALLSASAYLPAREAFRYDRRRAAAFAAALLGDRELALGELGLGGGVRSVRLGLDTAVVELLTRSPAAAVAAVELALRDGVHGEPDVPLLLAECVRRDHETTRSALAVAVGGGTPMERARAVAAVVGAAQFGPRELAVPALAAASLALAVVGFLQLPGMIGGNETATPRLEAPPPAVVVARPPRRSAPPTPRATQQRRDESEAIQIAVRPQPTRARSGVPLDARSNPRTNLRAAPARPAAPAPAAPPAAAAPSVPAAPSAAPPPPAGVAAAAVPASAAAPPPEPARQLTAEPSPSKAERKAAKAEQKAERKAERKADKHATGSAAAPAPAAVIASTSAADVLSAGAGPQDATAAQRGKHENREKTEKEKRDEDD